MGSHYSPLDVQKAIAEKTSQGGIGSYAILCRSTVNTAITEGQTVAGSSLRFSGHVGYSLAQGGGVVFNKLGSTPSGTWVAMAAADAYANLYSQTLFLRVA